jgi:hypothetical protein
MSAVEWNSRCVGKGKHQVFRLTACWKSLDTFVTFQAFVKVNYTNARFSKAIEPYSGPSMYVQSIKFQNCKRKKKGRTDVNVSCLNKRSGFDRIFITISLVHT